MTIDNPYWDAVKDCVETDTVGGNPVVGYSSLDHTVLENLARSPNRQLLVRPVPLDRARPRHRAVRGRPRRRRVGRSHCRTGYWAYLLTQLGVDVVCYYLNPGTELLTNGWHGEDMHPEVVAKDWAEAAALHPERTLFLSWPPHDQDVGARILLAYNGNRLIYVGDGRGGTGDDRMHQILETQWTEVDSRQPGLWWGQRDRVTVYERICP